MIRVLLCLAAATAVSRACSCLEQTPQEAYCAADWVSRVKVNSREDVPEANNSTPFRPNFYNIKYAVQHIEVFKKPSNLTSLPSTLFGSTICPSLPDIINGQEFLLAGGYHDGRVTTSLCGQVRPEVGNVFGPVLEWRQVPADFQAKMKAFKC